MSDFFTRFLAFFKKNGDPKPKHRTITNYEEEENEDNESSEPVEKRSSSSSSTDIIQSLEPPRKKPRNLTTDLEYRSILEYMKNLDAGEENSLSVSTRKLREDFGLSSCYQSDDMVDEDDSFLPNLDWDNIILDDSHCYKIIRKCGEGGIGWVYQAIRVGQNSKQYAIKAISRNFLLDKISHLKDVKREYELTKKLDHPNITKLFSICEDHRNVYLIHEYISGMEMFYYLHLKKKFSEFVARKYFKQLVSAIAYLHENRIIHRDLKLENLLLTPDYETIKIIDFGFAIQFSNKPYNRVCGTIGYIAPEMLSNEGYGHEIDLWCLGLILYEFLIGHSLYQSSQEIHSYSDVKRLINTKKIVYPAIYAPSQLAQDLINHLLIKDPKQRYTFDQIKAHRWYTL